MWTLKRYIWALKVGYSGQNADFFAAKTSSSLEKIPFRHSCFFIRTNVLESKRSCLLWTGTFLAEKSPFSSHCRRLAYLWILDSEMKAEPPCHRGPLHMLSLLLYCAWAVAFKEYVLFHPFSRTLVKSRLFRQVTFE